jgi:hypothetical protein
VIWRLTAACAKDATSTGYVTQWSDTTQEPSSVLGTATAYIFSPGSDATQLTCNAVNVNQAVRCTVKVAPRRETISSAVTLVTLLTKRP